MLESRARKAARRWMKSLKLPRQPNQAATDHEKEKETLYYWLFCTKRLKIQEISLKNAKKSTKSWSSRLDCWWKDSPARQSRREPSRRSSTRVNPAIRLSREIISYFKIEKKERMRKRQHGRSMAAPATWSPISTRLVTLLPCASDECTGSLNSVPP